MSFDKKVLLAKRALVSAEYRRLEPIQRVLKLTSDNIASQRVAEAASGIPRSSLQRAANAVAHNRPARCVGRPRHLDGADKENFEQTLLNRVETGPKPTIQDAQ